MASRACRGTALSLSWPPTSTDQLCGDEEDWQEQARSRSVHDTSPSSGVPPQGRGGVGCARREMRQPTPGWGGAAIPDRDGGRSWPQRSTGQSRSGGAPESRVGGHRPRSPADTNCLCTIARSYPRGRVMWAGNRMLRARLPLNHSLRNSRKTVCRVWSGLGHSSRTAGTRERCGSASHPERVG